MGKVGFGQKLTSFLEGLKMNPQQRNLSFERMHNPLYLDHSARTWSINRTSVLYICLISIQLSNTKKNHSNIMRVFATLLALAQLSSSVYVDPYVYGYHSSRYLGPYGRPYGFRPLQSLISVLDNGFQHFGDKVHHIGDKA